MKIQQMRSPATNAKVANQFTIDIGQYVFFQSYDTIIARKHKYTGVVVLSSDWDYSVTTSKYRNLFLGEDTKTIAKKVNGGEYEVVDTLDMTDPDRISLVWSVDDVFVRDATYRGGEYEDDGSRLGNITYHDDHDPNEVQHLPRITLEQARDILADIKKYHDCEQGVTWYAIDYGIDQHYDNLKGE